MLGWRFRRNKTGVAGIASRARRRSARLRPEHHVDRSVLMKHLVAARGFRARETIGREVRGREGIVVSGQQSRHGGHHR